MGSSGSGPALAEHAEPLSWDCSAPLTITLFHTQLQRIHNCAADLINSPDSRKKTGICATLSSITVSENKFQQGTMISIIKRKIN
jgi:hypothetical protein